MFASAIHQHESATRHTSVPCLLNPPPHPFHPDVAEHQLWVPCVIFHLWQCTCLNAILSNHTIFSFPQCVQNFVLYVSVSFVALHIGSWVPSFWIPYTYINKCYLSFSFWLPSFCITGGICFSEVYSQVSVPQSTLWNPWVYDDKGDPRAPWQPWGQTKIKRNVDGETVEVNWLGGLVVKNLPSNAGTVGSSPGRGAKMPHALWPKKPKHKTGATL